MDAAEAVFGHLFGEVKVRLSSPNHNPDFQSAYESYVSLVQFILKSFHFSQEERDDLVQDVFLRLFQTWDRIDSTKIKGFLSITTRNLAIDKVRQGRVRKTEAVGEDIALANKTIWEQDLDQCAAISIAERFIHEIALKEGGEAFGLFYRDGLSAREIAEKLGESTGTITSRISRMRQKFKDELKLRLEN